MAKAKQMPNGKWRLRVYAGTDDEGNKLYKSITCDTEAQCYKKEKEWLKSGGVVEKKQKDESITLGEALDAYIDKCEFGTKTYSPATIRGYKAARKSFKPYENIRLSNFKLEDLQDYIDLRAQSSSLKTIKNDIYLLRPALLLAKKKDIDFSDLELPEDEEKEDYIIPTDEEIQKLIQYFQGENDLEMVVAIVLGAFVGLRRSELCGLQWGDIDRETKTIHIRRALVMNSNAEYEEKKTKTRAGKRDLKVADEVMAILTRWMGDKIPAQTDRVMHLTPSALSGRYYKAVAKLGYGFTYHGLRHYHASIMQALGVPESYAVADMGHSDYTMIQRVYGQIVKAKEAAVAASMNSHTNTILNGETFKWG